MAHVPRAHIAQVCLFALTLAAGACGRTALDEGGAKSADAGAPDAGPGRPMAPGGYFTAGNAIYDASGKPHLFLGVDRPSLEWRPDGDHLSAADYQLMAGWRANTVRIGLNQDFWLAGAARYDPSYQATVDENVQWAHAAGLDVILELHWSDAGDLGNPNPRQQRMADANSLAFWEQVATRYRGDGRVLFELYNEPHDVSWEVWLSGGPSGNGFTAVGMQELYDAIRAAGAENLILVGGLNWADDLTGVPAHRVKGHNLAYVVHPYDYPSTQPSTWDGAWGFLMSTDPVIATELGDFDCSTGFVQAFIDYAGAHQLSWTAWAWYVGGCKFPSLVTDWSGTPSPPGQVVKDALLAR